MEKEQLELKRAQQNLAYNKKAGNSTLVNKYKVLSDSLKRKVDGIKGKTRSWDKHLGNAAQTAGRWSTNAKNVAKTADRVAKYADYLPVGSKRVKKVARKVARGARKFSKHAGKVANLSHLAQQIMKQVHSS